MRTFTNSELQKAKSISILELLMQNGHEPIKEDAKIMWFCSPLRPEKTASFAVYKNQNYFWDFGAGVGGDAIKLVCELQKITFVEAVKQLLKNETFFFVSPEHTQATSPKISPIIEAIKPLQNTFLLKYIQGRKIDTDIAKAYLKEIYYKIEPHQTKNYFGVGMENQSRGVEVKNTKTEQYYCIGSKDVTIIDNNKPLMWSIFEGMFDFLACLTYYQKPIQSNVIILHTLSNISKIMETPNIDTKQVFLFLDNDPAGDKATQKLHEHFSSFFGVKDCRHLYKNYKDFNEFLKKTNF